jgi:hypothetical protein
MAINVFPKVRDSYDKRATFRPEQQVYSGIGISIMLSTAVTAFPGSHSQPFLTLRATARTARRTGYGTHSFADDLKRCSRRNRLVLEHRSEHGPSSIVNGLRHFRFAETRRTHVADDYPRKASNQAGRGFVQKIFALIGDLGRQGAGASFHPETLKAGEFGFGSPIEGRCFDLGSIAESCERFQPKINPYLGALSPLSLWRTALDVDIPPAARVASKIPGPRLCAGGYRSGEPEKIATPEEGKNTSGKFGWSLEVRQRNPVKVALERAISWRPWETFITRFCKFGAYRIDAIRVQAKFFGHSSTEICEVKRGWALSYAPRLPSAVRLPVDLAAIVPDEIYGTRLRPQRPLRGSATVSDSIAVREEHAVDNIRYLRSFFNGKEESHGK